MLGGGAWLPSGSFLKIFSAQVLSKKWGAIDLTLPVSFALEAENLQKGKERAHKAATESPTLYEEPVSNIMPSVTSWCYCLACEVSPQWCYCPSTPLTTGIIAAWSYIQYMPESLVWHHWNGSTAVIHLLSWICLYRAAELRMVHCYLKPFFSNSNLHQATDVWQCWKPFFFQSDSPFFCAKALRQGTIWLFAQHLVEFLIPNWINYYWWQVNHSTDSIYLEKHCLIK